MAGTDPGARAVDSQQILDALNKKSKETIITSTHSVHSLPTVLSPLPCM